MTIPSLISIAHITPNPEQPRHEFDEAALQELADSIRLHGLLQPLTVYTTDGAEFTLLHGERRLRAAQRAGLAEVPCLVTAVPSRQQGLELALVENIQRADLSPADEARAYTRLHDEFSLTDEQIAQRVGKARSTVANIRRLVQLPAALLAQVGAGAEQLPMRYARALVPVAAAIPEKKLLQAAREIVQFDRLADIGRDPDDVIEDLVEDVTIELPRDGWELNWPAAPLDVTDTEGLLEIRACVGCPFFVESVRRCANRRCYAAKRQVWIQAEIERVFKKTRIAPAGPNETFTTIDVDWKNGDRIKQLVKEKAAHLRLVPVGDGQQSNWQMRNILGSPVVLLATTAPAALKAGDLPKANQGVPDNESAAAKARRLAAEEKASRLGRKRSMLRDARRGEREALRRARADVAWLGLHVAEVVANKIAATGSTLEFLSAFVDDRCRMGGLWPAIALEINAINEQLEKMTGKGRDGLLRRRIILKILYEEVPSYANDWEGDWPEAVEEIERCLTGDPADGDSELGLGLKLPAGWNVPPIHHTESNCWHCGRFTANAEMTQRDRAEGWGVKKIGDELKDVYCPDCGKKAIAKARTEGKPTTKSKKANKK